MNYHCACRVLTKNNTLQTEKYMNVDYIDFMLYMLVKDLYRLNLVSNFIEKYNISVLFVPKDYLSKEKEVELFEKVMSGSLKGNEHDKEIHRSKLDLSERTGFTSEYVNHNIMCHGKKHNKEKKLYPLL